MVERADVIRHFFSRKIIIEIPFFSFSFPEEGKRSIFEW